MNGLESVPNSIMNQDALYWVIGAVALVLLSIVFFVIYRVGRGRNQGLEVPSSHVPSRSPLPETSVTGAEAEELSARLSTGRAPANETVPASDLSEANIPTADLPADLAARPQGGLPEDANVAPHKIEEIQKAAPKPLFAALSNTRSSFFGRLKSVFGGKQTLAPNELEDIEEILYTSDLGPQTVQRLLDAVETRVKSEGGSGFDAVRNALKEEMLQIFDDLPNGVDHAPADDAGDGHGRGHLRLVTAPENRPAVHHGSEEYIEGLEALNIWDHKPAVVMVVGVNGAGKTTTIGKLARRLAQSGKRVLVAAGDTFRAAAGDQLKIWTERAQVEIFSPENVTDPSAVAFMACQQAQAGGFDVVIIDTAGRLHTQKNLMEELKKMKRVIPKQIPSGPHEVLLVLDANSGQNALMQAREFHGALEVTGVVLTKLDGSAKGGVAVGLAHELKIPIKLIGVGEGIDDLRRFSSREFVDSII